MSIKDMIKALGESKQFKANAEALEAENRELKEKLAALEAAAAAAKEEEDKPDDEPADKPAEEPVEEPAQEPEPEDEDKKKMQAQIDELRAAIEELKKANAEAKAEARKVVAAVSMGAESAPVASAPTRDEKFTNLKGKARIAAALREKNS